jgi:hypothetical protein
MAVKSVFDNPYYTQQTTDLPTSETNPGESGGNGGNWMGAVSAAGQGLSAAAGGEEGRFSIDPNAGFTGSFQGLGSGGVAGAIIGGISSQMGTFGRVNKNLKSFNAGFDGYDVDSYGDVQYNAEAFNSANRNVSELRDGQKAINKSIDPATRVFSGLYGTKKKLRKAQRQQELSLQNQQNEFNRVNAQSQYSKLNRRGYEDQLKNVYNIPMNYY